MSTQFTKKPMPADERKDRNPKRICRYCRIENPNSAGSVSPPLLTVVTLWSKGRTDPKMGFRRMQIAEGVNWPDGEIWIRWADGSERGGTKEVYPSIRVLQAKHGAHYEVIRREW